jgi:hypothetical protein
VVVLLALCAIAYAVKSVTVSLIVAIGAFISFVPEKRITPGLAAGIVFFGIIGSILAIGVDKTRWTLNSAELARFKFGENNVKTLLLVRSGDRGMLLYDRLANELTYVKSDELKAISWERLPLRRWVAQP